MKLCDTNVLIYAHREDSPLYKPCRQFVEAMISSDENFGISDVILSGFLRIVTHPKIFNPPTPLATAIAFTHDLIQAENAVWIRPGSRHWEIFTKLCEHSKAKGNLIPDAYLAALAIESDCTWISTDHDYSRFAKLKWENPFQ